MKKLSLLLVVMMAMVASTFAQGTLTPKVGEEWKVTDPIPEWNQYNQVHVVAQGSKYEYAVEKHVTKTLAQIIAGAGENTNRYFWEVLEVTVDNAGTPTMYTLVDAERTEYLNFDGVQEHFKELSWTQDINKFYLIRVSEFANHGDENKNDSSFLADLNTKTISEILVKIGDIINIHIPIDIDITIGVGQKVKNGADAYLCENEATPAGLVANFDARFGATRFKFNGRPLDDGSFIINLTVKKIKGSTVGTKIDVALNTATAAKANLTYDINSGYYTADISLADIQTQIGTALDVDASSEDIYYIVDLKGYEHGDGISTVTSSSTTATNEKASRTYGIYTTPKITKINHK